MFQVLAVSCLWKLEIDLQEDISELETSVELGCQHESKTIKAAACLSELYSKDDFPWFVNIRPGLNLFT